jgi:hypothetical protein
MTLLTLQIAVVLGIATLLLLFVFTDEQAAEKRREAKRKDDLIDRVIREGWED